MAGPALGGVVGAAVAAGVGALFGLGTAWVLALAGFGAAWGGFMAAAGAYSVAPLPVIGMLLDLSWSLPNTIIGAVWLVTCLLRGSLQAATTDSARSGTLVIAGAALPGAGATTLANVVGGTWYAHEEVHVWQARLFGPFYWPIYLLSYALNMLTRIITGRVVDLHWQSYGRDVMEDWAEQACPVRGGSPSRDIRWGWWLLGLLIAALHAACLLPVLGGLGLAIRDVSLPDAGLAGIAGGLGAMFVFALVRSFLPRTA